MLLTPVIVFQSLTYIYTQFPTADCSGTCIQKDKVSFMNTSQMGFWSTTPKKCRHEQATEASSSHHDVVEVDSPPFPPLLLNSSDGANSHVGLTTESEENPDNLSEMIHGFDDELLFRTDIYDPRSLSSARSPVFSFRSGSLVIMPLDGPRSNPESTSELLQESMTIPPHDIESPRFRDEIVRSEGSGLSSAYRPGHVPQVRSDARQVGAVQIAQQHYLFACNQPQSATSSPSSRVFEVHNNATMNTTVDLTAQERDSRKRSLRAELPDEILRFPRNSYDKPRRLLISPTLGVLCVTMRGSVLGVQDSQSRYITGLHAGCILSLTTSKASTCSEHSGRSLEAVDRRCEPTPIAECRSLSSRSCARYTANLIDEVSGR